MRAHEGGEASARAHSRWVAGMQRSQVEGDLMRNAERAPVAVMPAILVPILATLVIGLAGHWRAMAAEPVGSKPVPYIALSIVAPTNEETIYDNAGTVRVEVAIEPGLQVRHGHQLRISLDGVPVATLPATKRYALLDVERGTHVLGAAVIDRDGGELMSSASVTFYMWQASSLFPQRPDRPRVPPR